MVGKSESIGTVSLDAIYFARRSSGRMMVVVALSFIGEGVEHDVQQLTTELRSWRCTVAKLEARKKRKNAEKRSKFVLHYVREVHIYLLSSSENGGSRMPASQLLTSLLYYKTRQKVLQSFLVILTSHSFSF